MKAVILAGGLGTRISEESHLKPKPMIEIGGMPILWHIMKIYSHYGVYDFIICCGYKGYIIKEFFVNYLHHRSDILVDLSSQKIEVSNNNLEPWKIRLIDTGELTGTGGRLKQIKKYVKDDDLFHMTYGDGLSDININSLVSCHKKSKKMATVTAVTPPGRYGALELAEDGMVKRFTEKPRGDGSKINGGFFVLSSDCLASIGSEEESWEEGALKRLVDNGQLNSYQFDGFWQPMDTLREKNQLESLWDSKKAPWKKW